MRGGSLEGKTDPRLRPCGAIAGSGDNAEAKENWFLEKFGVEDIFTPENPTCSTKGAVVTNIAHIPEAMSKVMGLNGIHPDFPSRGDLSLKPWFASEEDIGQPNSLRLKTVEAMEPYNCQIAGLAEQVGVVFPRPDDERCLRRLDDGPEEPGEPPTRR